MQQPNLGDKVKCKITGMEGVVIAISKHLWGCDRVGVQPPIGQDGKMPESYWGDIDAVDVVERGVVKGHDAMMAEQSKDQPVRKTGGPTLPGQVEKRTNPR